MIRIKNVLVATDFSEPSEAALQYGRELARTFNAMLHVVHVADNVYTVYGGETYTRALPDLQREIVVDLDRPVERVDAVELEDGVHGAASAGARVCPTSREPR